MRSQLRIGSIYGPGGVGEKRLLKAVHGGIDGFTV